MFGMKRWFGIVVVLGLGTGCADLDALYVQADAATLEAIGPEYERYVDEDPALSEDQRARRLRTLDAWRARVRTGRAARSEVTRGE